VLLVLTYHRIVESPGEISGFFDVCAGELEAHVRAATAAWGGGTSPGALQKDQNGRGGVRRGFLVTFDDGTADHYYIAAPLLERNGLRGVFFVNTSLLGAPGYLSLSQCQELQARGHAIESHSHEHKVLPGLPEREMHRQLCESRRFLRDASLGQWNFLAVPGGYFNPAVIQVAKANGYRSLRTVQWGYNRKLDPFRVESIIINRKTARGWFRPLISPCCEASKKAVYRTKEVMKRCLPLIYARLLYARRG